MKGTKKLKRILAVLTAAVTITAVCSVAALAAPSEERGGASGDLWGNEFQRPEVWDSPTYMPDKHPVKETTYDPLQIIEEQTEHYYVKGSGKSVTITCNGEFKKFFSVFVDGAILEKNCYTVQSGSTVLTLMPEYLETLPVGAHTVTMNYTYGSVDTVLNVVDGDPNAGNGASNGGNGVSNPGGNNASAGNNAGAAGNNAASTGNTAAPKTGDASAVLLWSMVVLASGCSCAVLIRRKRVK